MTSINPTPNPNAQLAGLNASVPSPTPPLVVGPNGIPLADALIAGSNLGGDPASSAPFTIGTNAGSTTGGASPTTAANTPASTAAANAGANALTNSSTPAAGAQPGAPTAAAAGSAQGATATGTTTATAAATTVATTTTGALDPAASASVAEAVTGFGRADKNAPLAAKVGDATFEFPSFNSTKKKTDAPAIEWGPGWTKVQKDGLYYMQHTNGTKAVPAVEFRITPKPASKVKAVRVANGWGKKFPDGTILVFDRQQGPYRLDKNGRKHKVALGNHTFGGVKVRVFEATVVRTLEPNGMVNVFDSRGNHGAGTTRGRLAAAITGAGAGAKQIEGGGAPGKDGAPTKGGGSDQTMLIGDIQTMTAAARELVQQIRSGSMNPTKLAELQAQLSKLPAGIQQAAGAAGVMTGAPASGTDANQPAPPPAGTNSVDGGGAANAAAATTPVAGRDTDADKIKTLPAGSSASVTGVPASLRGAQVRFAQLPESVQLAVAKAFGSNQGDGAFEAEQMIAFSADGATVKLPEAGRVFLRKVATIRGAGPGEDMAMTMRPNRQPGEPRPTARASSIAATRVMGGGASGAKKTSTAAVSGGGGVSATSNATTTSTAAKKLPLFKPGTAIDSPALAGLEGSFTWKSLPATARAAIQTWIAQHPASAAAKAMASRTGSGWAFDQNATVVLGGGAASFLDGLALVRATPAVRGGGASATGGGGLGQASGAAPGASPSTEPIGHDATRHPVTGGGAPAPSSNASNDVAAPPGPPAAQAGAVPGAPPAPPTVPGDDGHNAAAHAH